MMNTNSNNSNNNRNSGKPASNDVPRSSTGDTKDVTSILFQDAMDPTRFLRIKENRDDKTVMCKIFFKETGKELVYHGLSEQPKSLFWLEGGTRVGYNPYDAAREAEQARFRAMREQRRQYERDEE